MSVNKKEDKVEFDTDTVEASTLEVGRIIVLSDGETRAKIVDIGDLEHEIKKTIVVKAITYEILEGEWKGATTSVPLLPSDEVDAIRVTKDDIKSSWWFGRLFNRSSS